MKGCIVAVCASAATDLAVPVRACESGVQHNLLQALAVFTFEISYKRIITLPIRKSIFFKLFRHDPG